MAASDYVPIFFKNRLHLAGRPQMSSRPSWFWTGSSRRANVTAVKVIRRQPISSCYRVGERRWAEQAAGDTKFGLTEQRKPRRGSS